jgi:hypothetical protein
VNPKNLKSEAERWIEFYDHYGRMTELRFSPNDWTINEAPLEFLLNGFAKDPSRLGLLRLAGFWCAAGRKPQVAMAPIPLEQFEDQRFRLAAMLVTISRPDLTYDEAHQIANYIPVIAVDGEPDSVQILLTAVERHATEIPALENLIAKLANVIPTDQWSLRARVEVLRNAFLQARPSGFDDQMLSSIGLPLIEP